MIEAHVLDAWTRGADRQSAAFRAATILGGFAAPLFLWLAGVTLVLSAARSARRHGRRAPAVETICRRGMEIFVLAFLFRLQAFILTPGSHPLTLFRVDILNIMGPAIALAGIVWGVSRSTPALVATYAALTAAVAMATPIVRTAEGVSRLPLWVQWYVRPAGEYTTFTALPWVGFVFAGAAVGALLAFVDCSAAAPDEGHLLAAPLTALESRGARAESRLHATLTCAGAGLVLLGFGTASLPSIYPQSSFWTSSPTFFAIRLGVLMMLLPVVYLLSKVGGSPGLGLPALERLGRRSLFVYWIHVELVYGYASWVLHGRLSLSGVAVAYVVFSLLMSGAAVWWEHWLAGVARSRLHQSRSPAILQSAIPLQCLFRRLPCRSITSAAVISPDCWRSRGARHF